MRYAIRQGTGHRRAASPLEEASQLALGIKQRQNSRRGIVKKEITNLGRVIVYSMCILKSPKNAKSQDAKNRSNFVSIFLIQIVKEYRFQTRMKLMNPYIDQ